MANYITKFLFIIVLSTSYMFGAQQQYFYYFDPIFTSNLNDENLVFTDADGFCKIYFSVLNENKGSVDGLKQYAKQGLFYTIDDEQHSLTTTEDLTQDNKEFVEISTYFVVNNQAKKVRMLVWKEKFKQFKPLFYQFVSKYAE